MWVPWSTISVPDPPALLGRGAYGVVVKGSLRGQEVAIKEIRAHNKSFRIPEMEAIRREVEILEEADTEFVVQLLGASWKLSGGLNTHVRIVMEVALCDLATLLRARPEAPKSLRVAWFRDLCAATNHLHRRNFVHLDIKTNNILLFEGLRAKITDFGLAMVSGQSMSTLELCNAFQAPEIQRTRVARASLDVYAVAATSIHIFSNGEPARDNLASQILDPVNRVPLELQPILAASSDTEPDLRPTSSRILSIAQRTLVDIGDPRTERLHQDASACLEVRIQVSQLPKIALRRLSTEEIQPVQKPEPPREDAFDHSVSDEPVVKPRWFTCCC